MNQELIVKTVEDSVVMMKNQASLLQTIYKDKVIDPVFHSCIKQLEGLLSAEKSRLNKLNK